MSGAPQGPGWWLASDGRWYPPQQASPHQLVGPPQTPANRNVFALVLVVSLVVLGSIALGVAVLRGGGEVKPRVNPPTAPLSAMIAIFDDAGLECDGKGMPIGTGASVRETFGAPPPGDKYRDLAETLSRLPETETIFATTCPPTAIGDLEAGSPVSDILHTGSKVYVVEVAPEHAYLVPRFEQTGVFVFRKSP